MSFMDEVSNEAFVTLATTDAYALGALVLASSLRRSGTTRRLAIMVPPSGLSDSIRAELHAKFDHVEEVNVMNSDDAVNLDLLTRPDLGVTFTKLHCWRLTQYEKCVFLDADTLVLDNVDSLFEREELSAAPDAGWPDCFNSGVFVFRPSLDTYNNLKAFALANGSFDGGDQGLLNMYFSDWATRDIARHLPFTYNVVAQAFYSYPPAFKHYGKDVKIVHFIGGQKPWHATYNKQNGQVQGTEQSQFLQLWWEFFLAYVQPSLDPSQGGAWEGQRHYTDAELADPSRQYSWEKGNIDYMGIDAFDNIQRRIDEVLRGHDSNNKRVAKPTGMQ